MNGRNVDCVMVRGIPLDIKEQHQSERQVQVEGIVQTLWVAEGSSSISVPHRRAVSFDCLLQVVIVGQNLHEEVQLQSLSLQDKKNKNPRLHKCARKTTKLCDSQA